MKVLLIRGFPLVIEKIGLQRYLRFEKCTGVCYNTIYQNRKGINDMATMATISDVDILPARRNYITEEERLIARNAIEAVKESERARSAMFRYKSPDGTIQKRLSERRLREAADEDF
jgi:hypothetical protein